MKATILKFTALLFLLSCNKNSDSFKPIHTNSGASLTSSSITKCGYDFDEDNLIKSGWSKIFYDNFGLNLEPHPIPLLSDFVLDKSKWIAATGGGNDNGELQKYIPDNVKIVDGDLQLQAIKQNASSCTSGKIISLRVFNPLGTQDDLLRFYARIKLPKGYGIWPAFWTYSEDFRP